MGRLYQTENFVNGIGQGAQTMVHDGDALVAVFNASGTLIERHIHGPSAGTDDPVVSYYTSGVSPHGSARFLQTDARGSIVYSSDRYDGNRVINTYDEYGQPSANNQGRFQYTGQVWLPELGMYYYKARIYSPQLGRFMQTDPIGYEDNVNLYGYVGQDPINGVDPTGMYECAEGSDCGAIKDYHDALEKVSSDTRKGSRIHTTAARNAKRVLDTIGRPNEDNGVTIATDDDLGSDANAQENSNFFGAANGTYTITLNTRKIREGARQHGVSENVVGAVFLAQEAIHVAQLKDGMSSVMAMEIQAYAIDYNIGLALGWDQNTGGLSRRTYLLRRALKSCAFGHSAGGAEYQACENAGINYLNNGGN